MNEKFLELPKEKQLRIVNAAMEVFAQNEYKHAVTDDIAAKAGISKGLLFYYFHNKKGLYLYVHEYSKEIIVKRVCNDEFNKIDDFFELMLHSLNIKVELMQENPYIYDFVMRVYFETNKEVADTINKDYQEMTSNAFKTYFGNINFSKFKEGIDQNQVIRMIIYMAKGYLSEQQTKEMKDLALIKEEFMSWMQILKASVYKEEFLV